MSIVEYSAGTGASGEVRVPVNHRALHRLGTVRRLQGISRRTLARRMNVDVAEIRRQEEETNDLPLSVLYEWQKALDVPIAELLVESEDALSQPLLQRAQLVRLMKTALAILEQADNEATRVMAQTLVDQLVEVMPELQGISAWHAVGTPPQPGRVGHRRHANTVRGHLPRSCRLTDEPSDLAVAAGKASLAGLRAADGGLYARRLDRAFARPSRAASCSAWRFLVLGLSPGLHGQDRPDPRGHGPGLARLSAVPPPAGPAGRAGRRGGDRRLGRSLASVGHGWG